MFQNVFVFLYVYVLRLCNMLLATFFVVKNIFCWICLDIKNLHNLLYNNKEFALHLCFNNNISEIYAFVIKNLLQATLKLLFQSVVCKKAEL